MNERTLDRLLNSQKEPRRFARVLGKPPRIRKPDFAVHVDPSEVFEALGPGEKYTTKGSALLFWNLVRDDGKTGFTVFAKPNTPEIHVSARTDWVSLHNWLLDRLSEIAHNEHPPTFVGRSNFIIAKVQ